MTNKQHPKQLLVEGREDQYAVSGLMGRHVRWGNTATEWPVLIEAVGSVDELLADSVIPVYLKQSGLKALGILIDADDCLAGRWERLSQLCSQNYPGFPQSPAQQGIILQNPPLPRLGIWIMPDNQQAGMLETFLKYLVPTTGKATWEYAQQSAEQARSLGAPFKNIHQDKAHIHTWLAWQDPPGKPLGEALKNKCLDPQSPYASAFVDWFVRLYELNLVIAAG